MVWSREKFKTAFATSGKNKERLRRRADKITDELVKARETIDAWKADGVNDGYKPYEAQLVQCENDVAARLKLGKDDPGDAYRALSETKDVSRALLLEVRRERPLVLDVPGVKMKLSSQILPDFDKLSEKERAEKIAVIGEKIGMGKAIADALLSDPEEVMRMIEDHGPPTREDIANLSWFLRSKAEEGESWRKGALSLPDPGGHVRAYLDKCSEVYGRDSSHLKGDQDEHHGQARGIDFYEGKDDPELLLPYGMNALLFQRFERKGEERLYLKMETESARCNPLFKRKDETPTSRALQSADIGRSILHLKNLLSPEKDKSGLARHAEKFGDIPEIIRQAYEALQENAKDYPNAKQLLANGSSTDKNEKLKAIEVQQMAANVADLRQLVAQLDGQRKALDGLGVDTDFVDEALDLLLQWDLLVKDTWGPGADEQIAVRIGDEVILDLEQLLMA